MQKYDRPIFVPDAKFYFFSDLPTSHIVTVGFQIDTISKFNPVVTIFTLNLAQ
jgi:hypothetical protein